MKHITTNNQDEIILIIENETMEFNGELAAAEGFNFGIDLAECYLILNSEGEWVNESESQPVPADD